VTADMLDQPKQRSMSSRPGPWYSVATVLVALAGLMAMLWRYRYGVDMLDESFYVAEALRFARGARPFVDVLDPHQLAAWFASPVAALHMALVGSTEAIVASFRVAHALLALGVGTLMFFALDRYVDWQVALLAVTSAFCLLPGMAPSLSYNTMGGLLLASAIALGGLALAGRRPTVASFLSGACLGLCGLVYPTLLIVGLLSTVIWWLLTRSSRRVAALAAGFAFVWAIVLALLARDLHALPLAIAYTQELSSIFGYATGWPKLVSIVLGFGRLLTLPAIWLALAVVLTRLFRLSVAFPVWAVLLGTVVLVPIMSADALAPAIMSLLLMLVGLTAIPTRSEAEVAGDSARRFWIWAFVLAGLGASATAYSSAGGLTSAGFAALGVAAPAAALLLHRIVATQQAEVPTRRFVFWRTALVVLSATFLVGGLLVHNYLAAFVEQPPVQLNQTVTKGPYRYLITSQKRKAEVDKLRADLLKQYQPGDRIVSLYSFAAPYLMTPALPAAHQTLIVPDEGDRATTSAMFIESIKASGNGRVLLVVNKAMPDPVTYQGQISGRAYSADRDVLMPKLLDASKSVIAQRRWDIRVMDPERLP